MLNDIYQSIDPVLFAFGPFTVRWYGVAYVLGFVFAGLVIWRVARRWRVRVDADSLLTIMFCVIIGVIVGGRLGYVLFYGEGYYFQHPEQILAFNKGGMSFHGGLIGALLAGIAAAKLTRIPYLTLADLGCIGAPLGLLFGRCANFINGELWGAPTDAAWGVVFGGAAGTMPRHPSQLYEAFLEGVVIFAVLYLLSRRMPPRPRGTGIRLSFEPHRKKFRRHDADGTATQGPCRRPLRGRRTAPPRTAAAEWAACWTRWLCSAGSAA